MQENSLARFLAGRSLAMGKFRPSDKNAHYVSGMSTLMMKLPPELIGGSMNRFMDRKLASGFTAVTVRMRLRDMCRLQVEALIPKLQASPRKDLCFVNIAGGSASDSINTLILISKQKLDLIKNRMIEINVLDVDSFGPNFAEKSIEALKAPNGSFQGLDISFKHVPYDWNKTTKLADLLSERKNSIVACSSEGGLFEYCADDDIINNLNCLYDNSSDDLTIVGDIVLELGKVNPAFPALLESSGNNVRFFGIEGLKKILDKTNWKLDKTIEGNPCYLIFELKWKNRTNNH
jgi:hypothetical protein